MSDSSFIRGVLRTLFAALLALPLAAFGDGALPFSTLEIVEPQRHFSDTQECVEPEEEMRRNHMEYILHQRDETVHEGIRTRQYALEECINCHASKDETGEYVRVEDPRHFCASCHTYASVNIDCFQCHADVPVRDSRLQTTGVVPEDTVHQLAAELQQLLAAEGRP
jgi:hypothetical protein